MLDETKKVRDLLDGISRLTPRAATSSDSSMAGSVDVNQVDTELKCTSEDPQKATCTSALDKVIVLHCEHRPLPNSKKRRTLRQRLYRQFIAFVLRRAVRSLQNNRPHTAFLILRQLAGIVPHNIIVRICLARAALADGQVTTAATSIRPQVIAGLPRISLHYRQLAALHIDMENFDLAAHYLQLAESICPGSNRLWHLLGMLFDRQGKVDRAVACFSRRFEIAPLNQQKSEALLRAADLLAAAGRSGDAVSAYRRLVEMFPVMPAAYFGLVDADNSVTADDPLIYRIRQLLESHAIGNTSRGDLHFAMGIAYDRSDDVGSAFAHFALANRLHGHRFMGCQPNYEAEAEARRDVFNDRVIADLSQYGCQEDFLICIVGMPRSGTTLVEQMLAGHSEVHALGEREDFLRLIKQLPTNLKSKHTYPHCCQLLSPDIVEASSRTIRNRLRSLSGSSIRSVTKLPGDVWELGLIKILFPKVRIIHMMRRPIDTCWSCFRQNFKAVPYATDLETLAAAYRGYERVVDHWREALPQGSMLELSYETLVTEPEATIRSICAFCNIAFEYNCMEYYSQDRLIRTRSRWEVRKPIYLTSVRRSDRYREYLGPLLALEQEVAR
jgi:tetratricopeptide (TPR) repeat protein